MIMKWVLLAAGVQLLVVHMVDGREVQINPKEIVRIQEGRSDDDPKRALVKGVHCVIWMTDGDFLSVSESCDEVRKLME